MIVDIIFFYIISLATSVGIFLSMLFQLVKDLADEGYKFNFETLINEYEQTNDDDNVNNLIFFLIPLFNIFYSIYISKQYIDSRELIIDKLRLIDVLEKMSSEEQEKYLINPTGLNALSLNTETINIISNIKLEDGSQIFFEQNKEMNDIRIIKVLGLASELSELEQKKKVLKKVKESEIIKDEFKKRVSNSDIEGSLSNQIDKIQYKKHLLEFRDFIANIKFSKNKETVKEMKLKKIHKKKDNY